VNRREVATLLGAASAVDPKVPQPDPDVLTMWAAILDDVPAKVAADAVRAHYRHHAGTIMPADIVEHWRIARRDAAERRQRAELTARPRRLDDTALHAIRAGIARVTAALAAARGIDLTHAETDADARRTWLAVPCPYCDARPNNRCAGPGGRPLARSPAHPARLDLAFAATTTQGDR